MNNTIIHQALSEKVLGLAFQILHGGYRADLVVDNKIILELKSVKELNPCMEAQIVNYLRLSKVPVGYLVNFNGQRVVWKRFVYQRE